MPMVTLLLAVEATATPEFTNLSGLLEAYEKPIVVPAFQGIHCIIEHWRVGLRCCLHLGGIQLGRVDCISVISFLSRRLSVVMLCRLWGVTQPSRSRWRIMGTCQGVILFLLQQCPQKIQGGGMRLILQMYHHRVVFR